MLVSDPFYSYTDLPMNFGLRFVTILVAILMLYGLWKEKSTPIAVFLWTIFEVNILFVTLYCFKSVYGSLAPSERLKELAILSEYDKQKPQLVLVLYLLVMFLYHIEVINKNSSNTKHSHRVTIQNTWV